MKWIIFVIGLLTGALVTGFFENARHRAGPLAVADTTYVEVIDTVPYLCPVAVDSTVVCYRIVPLPLGRHESDTVILRDTAYVQIPIEQKRYEDSTYRAWVSGYQPSLDSIYVYPRQTYISTVERVKQPPNRWGVGITAGAAYTPKGFQPYIGLGVTYSIKSF